MERNGTSTGGGTGREGERMCPQSDGAVPTRPISNSGSGSRPSRRDEEGRRSSGDQSEDEFFEALEDHDAEEEEDSGGITVSSSSQVGERGLEEGGGEEEEKMEGERERKKGSGGKVEGKKEGEETRGKMEGEGEGETNSVSQQQTEDRSDEPVGGAVGGDEGEGGRAGVVGGSGREGMGRLQQCGDLVIIATGEPMYIPVTQVNISIHVVVIEITFLPLPALHVVTQLIFPKKKICMCIHLLLSLVCFASPLDLCLCMWFVFVCGIMGVCGVCCIMGVNVWCVYVSRSTLH